MSSIPMGTTVESSASIEAPTSRPFPAILREAITTGLVEVLGSAGAKAAFYYLDLSNTEDARQVHAGLVEVFGSGARALEVSVLRELYSRLGARFEPEGGRTFADYVLYAKRLHGRLPTEVRR